MTFDIKIPETQETGRGYPIYINQISITNNDESTETASARHGGVSVYKNGDSNGDNDVDVGDVMNLVDYICKDTPETFIKEVSDIDEDNTVDVNDIMGVIDIIME